MARTYRIYIGARNTPDHTFLPADERLIKRVVKRYFRGWTIQEGKGFWSNSSESTRIIITTDAESNMKRNAGDAPIEACIAQLKQHLQQYAVMLETGGDVSFL